MLTFFPTVGIADIYKFIDATGQTFYGGDAPTRRIQDQKLKIPYAATIYAYSPFVPHDARDSSLDSVRFMNVIEREGRIAGVDPDLLHAVINVESAYDPMAVSEKGAIGLMQLMPATLMRFDVHNPYDPDQNIKGGARYLGQLLNMFDQDVTLALAAYNAGEGSVLRNGKKPPPYRETQDYISKVLKRYKQIQ